MFLQMQVWAFLLLQESGAVGWDVVSLWKQMGSLAKAVVILLFLMSAYSIGVMIDRLLAFNAARKQSRLFAPAVAGALRDGKLDEAIKIADRYKKSHLAKVVVAGLQEFRAHQISADISLAILWSLTTVFTSSGWLDASGMTLPTPARSGA